MTEGDLRLGLLGDSFLYFYTGDSSAVTRCNITLKDEPDPHVLKEALKAVLRRFDLFRQRPFLDREGHVVLKENTEEPVIYAYDGKRAMLGTAESAGYLFRVLLYGKVLITEIFHGLTDARGAWQFTQTLLYEYLSARYGFRLSDDRIFTASAPREESEDELLYERILKELSEKETPEEAEEGEPSPVTVLSPAKAVSDKKETDRYVLSYRVSDVLGIARDLSVTVTSFFMCVFARALYELEEADEKGCVVTEMPVDMRPLLMSRSLSNFSSNVLIPFERNLLAKPLGEQALAVKEVMRSRVNADHLYREIGPYAAALSALSGLPLDNEETIRALKEKAGASQPERSSFMLSNVGVLKLPEEMEGYITDVDFESESLKDNPEIILYSYGDTGRIMMLWKHGNPSFMNRIGEILSGYGLETEVMPEKDCREDYVLPWKFERITE